MDAGGAPPANDWKQLKEVLGEAVAQEAERGDPVVDLGPRTPTRGLQFKSSKQEQGVTHQEFHDFLLMERDRVRHCATLPFTLLIWLTFGLVAWFHGNVHSMHRMRRGIQGAVEEIRAPHTLLANTDSAFTTSLTLDSLTTAVEVWSWIGNGLVPAMEGSPARPGFVRTFNKVVGGVQLRQRRLKMGSCLVEDSLAAYYRGQCRATAVCTEPFGPASADSDPAFAPGGHMPDISGTNEKRFFAWLDVERPATARQRAEQLSQLTWCDDATDVVEVHVALVNPEVAAFAHVSVAFTFERGGLVEKELEVNPLSAYAFPTIWYMIVDILWVILVVVLFFFQLQDVADRTDRKGCRRCCNSGWTFCDWVSIVLGLGMVGFFVVFAQGLSNLSEQLGALGENPTHVGEAILTNPNSTAAQVQNIAASTRVYEGKVTTILEDLQLLIQFRSNHRLSMFWYGALILLRFFRGFLGQPRIATIGRTLAVAAADLLHLGLILIVVFENFVLGGCALFGMELKAWASFSRAQRSTVAMLSGRGDFSAMYEKSPVSASFWLFAFVVCLVFVLANMLMAIIVYHHGEELTKGASQASQSFPEQLWSLLGDWVWKASYHCREVHRFVYERGASWLRKRLPIPREEPRRVWTAPYEAMLEAVGSGEDVGPDLTPKPGRPLPWAVLEEELLIDCGCDSATAEYLLGKCAACTRGRLPTDFPADRVLHEFHNSMEGSYRQLDAIGEEVCSWLNDRLIDCGNMEPRQKKLEALSKVIEPAAEPPESDMMAALPAPVPEEPAQSEYPLTNPEGLNMLTN